MSNERTSLLLIAAGITAGLVLVLAQNLVPYFGSAGFDMHSVIRGFGILTTIASMVRIAGLVGLATARPTIATIAIVTVLAMVFGYAIPFLLLPHLNGTVEIVLANTLVAVVIHLLTWATLRGVAVQRRRPLGALYVVFFCGFALHALGVLFLLAHSFVLSMIGIGLLATFASLVESSALLAMSVSLAQDA